MIYSLFCSCHKLWVLIRNHLDEAVLRSTPNLCFTPNKKIIYIPVDPTFPYIKWAFPGVFITQTC